MTTFIHFFWPLGLTIKLNFNMSKDWRALREGPDKKGENLRSSWQDNKDLLVLCFGLPQLDTYRSLSFNFVNSNFDKTHARRLPLTPKLPKFWSE